MQSQHFVDLAAKGRPQLGRRAVLFSPLAEPQEGLQARKHRCQDADEPEADPQAYMNVALKGGEHTCADERREYDDRDSEPDVQARKPRRVPVVLRGGRRGPSSPVRQQLENPRRPRRRKLSTPLRGLRTHLRSVFHDVPRQGLRSVRPLSRRPPRVPVLNGHTCQTPHRRACLPWLRAICSAAVQSSSRRRQRRIMAQPEHLAAASSPVQSDEPDKLEPGVALCLSGGGYRAMLFHIGAIWRLNELRYLPSSTASRAFPAARSQPAFSA